MGRRRRHKTADLRHKHNEGCLPHIRRFPCHIGTSDDCQTGIAAVQIGIIGDKLSCHGFFHHGMTTFFDVNDVAFIHHRFGVILFFRNFCQGLQCVNDRNDVGAKLNPFHFCRNGVTDFRKELVFQIHYFFFGTQNQLCQIIQFRCNETLAVGKGLFTDIVFRHIFQIGLCHFQIITENFIETDFQVFDACFFPFFFFHLFDPCLAFCFSFGIGIQFIGIPRLDHAAFSYRKRRVFHNCLINQVMDVFQRVQFFIDFLQISAFASAKGSFQQGQIFNGIFQHRQFSGIGCLIYHTSHNTFKVKHGTENILDFFPQEQIVFQFFHGIQTFANFRCGKQRLFHPFSQSSGAHGCFGFIQHTQQRAFLIFLPHGFCQFQISPAGNIQWHKIANGVIFQYRNMLQIIFLGFQQVPEQPPCRGNSNFFFRQPKTIQR